VTRYSKPLTKILAPLTTTRHETAGNSQQIVCLIAGSMKCALLDRNPE